MSVGCETVAWSCRPGARRFAWALASLLFLVSACDECWMGGCGESFVCDLDTIGIIVEETRIIPAPFCSPYDSFKSTYTAESRDTTIVTVTVDGHLVTFVGRGEGSTTVELTATLEGTPGTGYFSYYVDSTPGWQGEVTACEARRLEGYTKVQMSAWVDATIRLLDVTVHLGIGDTTLGTYHFDYLDPFNRVSFNTSTEVNSTLANHECTLDVTFTVDR